MIREVIFPSLPAIQIRQEPCCIIYVRSHQTELGLGEGNAKADAVVIPAFHAPTDSFNAARESHAMFHQSAKVLRRQFGFTWRDARGLVRTCSQCSQHGTGLGLGVDPRGLKACELWQMDVTHVPKFGRLKYVHVSIDTFSKMLWDTAQVGESAIHMFRHLTVCFMVMGLPKKVKTDNGPTYCSQKIGRFLQRWGLNILRVSHMNPRGRP